MMIKEFLHQKQELSFDREEDLERRKRMKVWTATDHPDLSLGPSRFITANGSSLDLDANTHQKRKFAWDQFKTDPMVQTSVELQLKDPLPLDWEQCLDLESGRMYYLNRKTLKRSWNWPKDQAIDLELNISTLSGSDGKISKVAEDPKKNYNSSSNMIAVACLKCHLLVMLCKSSPSCPNCKFLHSLPAQQTPPPKLATTKTLETLSLLN